MRLDHNQFGNLRHATEHDGSRRPERKGIGAIGSVEHLRKKGGVRHDVSVIFGVIVKLTMDHPPSTFWNWSVAIRGNGTQLRQGRAGNVQVMLRPRNVRNKLTRPSWWYIVTRLRSILPFRREEKELADNQPVISMER